MEEQHRTRPAATGRKPPSMEELLKLVRPQVKKTNPRRAFKYYCQRTGQGRFTRPLRSKAQIRAERKRQRRARRAARA